jgi:hypothetical protein
MLKCAGFVRVEPHETRYDWFRLDAEALECLKTTTRQACQTDPPACLNFGERA